MEDKLKRQGTKRVWTQEERMTQIAAGVAFDLVRKHVPGKWAIPGSNYWIGYEHALHHVSKSLWLYARKARRRQEARRK